jgi:hypothetical protein
VNERLGTSFSKSDELIFEQAKQDDAADADVNAIDTWKFLYDRKFEDLLVERLQRNPEIVSWALSDPERLRMIRDLYAAEVYDACRKAAADPA